MRITYFISNFPKSGGFIAAHNLWLELIQRGHHVQVFTSSEDRKDHVDSHKGIVFHKYGSFLNYRSEHVSFDLLYKPLSYDTDIVHVQSGISLALLAGFRYAMKKKKPLIITWHGDAIKEYGRYSGIIAGIALYLYNTFLVDRVLSKADVIISLSESYINESKFLGRYVDKIVVIPNGINLDEFDIPYSKEECKNDLRLNEDNVILFLGSIHPLKGPDILLKAVPNVLEKYTNILFVFAGNGNIDEYKKLSEKLGVKKYVRFVGYIENEKCLYYKASDIFILSSLTECFPLVNLEAMACGIPIIASKVGGVPDLVIDGKNGMIVLPGDSRALADAIIYLLENKSVREKMGKNGKELIKYYSWARIAERTENVYNGVIIAEKNII